MRRRARFLSVIAAAALAASAALAQPRPRHEAAPAPHTAAPPHAFLFGTWTGGLFPVLDTMLEQDCRTQPTVVFSQDVVGHATLTGAALVRREVETVRTTPAGAEFRFTPSDDDPAGFGCENPNVLHVERNKDGSVSFPNCSAFPYPLQRCPR